MPAPLIPIGQLIDRTWEYYRQNLSDLLSISGWILLTAIFSIVGLAMYPDVTTLASGAALSGSEIAGTVILFLNSSVFAPVIGLWVLCAITRFMAGSKGSAAAKEGWRYFWPAVAVSVLVQLMMLGGLFIGFGPAIVFLILAWLLNNSALLLLGNFLLVLGVFASTVIVLRWVGFYILSPYSLLLENIRGKAALKQSRALVEGRFWSVITRYALPKLFFVVVGIVIMTMLQYVVNIMISAAAGLNLDVQLRLLSIASAVIPTVLAALMNPLVVISDVLLYNNLKGR
jgi:hypothetical protein